MQYKEGYSIDGRYCLKDFVGSGSFGEVWVATDMQTDLEVAVKIYTSMDAKGLSDFKKEFQLSFDLNHANLLHANYLGVNPEDNRAYLVMPYCPDGSSTKLCGVIDENRLWVFIRDVATGLSYLHGQQSPIIHQDIKPDNILIKNGEFVITDFGISKQLRSTLSRSTAGLNTAGAVAYMGPERFSKQYQAVKASDIWSLGVTIYELATGDLPFCGMGGSMQNGGAEIPELPKKFSKELNGLMTACLAHETWNRPTAALIAEYSDHFIKYGTGKPPWKHRERGKKLAPKFFPKWLYGLFAVVVVAVLSAVLLIRSDKYDAQDNMRTDSTTVVAEVIPETPVTGHALASASKSETSAKLGTPAVVELKTITLSKTALELKEGSTATLTVKYTPNNTTDKATTWKSTDASIAKVSVNGKVTALKAGSAAIVARCGDKDAYCNVTVKAKEVEPLKPTQTAQQTSSSSSSVTQLFNRHHMGHEWVDLGLSVKWATCNVGASRPEEYGSYFAWGETMPNSYGTENQRYSSYIGGWNNVKFSKYVTESKYGIIDYRTRLEMYDDAARANWSGSWRMPTINEFQELINGCTWTWTTMNGIKGYKVVSKSNKKSIFLPAAGVGCDPGDDLDCIKEYIGPHGNYSSSSLVKNNSSCAYILNFDSRQYGTVNWGFRGVGFSVRPVFN